MSKITDSALLEKIAHEGAITFRPFIDRTLTPPPDTNLYQGFIIAHSWNRGTMDGGVAHELCTNLLELGWVEFYGDHELAVPCVCSTGTIVPAVLNELIRIFHTRAARGFKADILEGNLTFLANLMRYRSENAGYDVDELMTTLASQDAPNAALRVMRGVKPPVEVCLERTNQMIETLTAKGVKIKETPFDTEEKYGNLFTKGLIDILGFELFVPYSFSESKLPTLRYIIASLASNMISKEVTIDKVDFTKPIRFYEFESVMDSAPIMLVSAELRDVSVYSVPKHFVKSDSILQVDVTRALEEYSEVIYQPVGDRL